MRWALLSALVSLLTAQVGLCQQPVLRDRSVLLYQESAPISNGSAIDAPPPAPGGRADELSELKTTVLQLQQRVNQLSLPAGTPANGPAWPSRTYPTPGEWARDQIPP